MPDHLTGGDWENRANEYWLNWHRSASIAGDEQMRREQLERDLAATVEAAEAYFREFDHMIGDEDYPERRDLREALDSYGNSHG